MASGVVILTSTIILSLFSTSIYASVSASLSSGTGGSSSSSSSSEDASNCVTFDSEGRTIIITCKTTNLTQIDDRLRNPDVIRRDEVFDKGWILNAGITVAENAALYINSSDTSWLKIISDGETAYPIHVSGS